MCVFATAQTITGSQAPLIGIWGLESSKEADTLFTSDRRVGFVLMGREGWGTNWLATVAKGQ